MPRRPRVFVNGALYHVYCRVARGEPVFAEREEARRFVSVVGEVRDRDGFAILAWCLMSNHYHLALRTGRVPLWRSMRLIQGRSSVGYCRRKRIPGPLWQGRYQAKVIEDQAYLNQLVAYIHLNPVVAGMARDPAAYRWSGHGEIVGRRRPSLVDVETTLALYGDTPDGARIAYLSTLRGPVDRTWVGDKLGKLPWWQRQEPLVENRTSRPRPALDALGASTAPSPVPLDAKSFLRRALRVLKLQGDELSGRHKAQGPSLAREAVVLVGVEQFAVRVCELAELLGMNSGSVSRVLNRAAERRWRDTGFASICQGLESTVAVMNAEAETQSSRH